MKQTYTEHAALSEVAVWTGFVLSILAGIAGALAGFGSRWGWRHFTVGFTILGIAAFNALAAAAISLIGGTALRHEHHAGLFMLAEVGILTGLVTAWVPWSWMRTAEQAPKINDISTDTTNPPQFIKIMPLRQSVNAPTRYAGPLVANQQRAAYPDIKPVILPVAPSTAFAAALKEAGNRGWQIVSSDASSCILEAVATTFWFGFKDDVVVRITAVSGGSRVDMRSVSRVGTGDIGANANRIRSYLTSLASNSIVDQSYNSAWY